MRDLDAASEPAAHVLLVEPDPLQREIVAAALRLYDRSLTTVAVAQAHAALRVLESEDVDLVVTELEFPLTDSVPDYIQRLRMLAPSVPILAMSSERSVIAGIRSRVDAVLRKPADMDDLMRTAEALLKRRRESVVRGLTLESFLQILQLERKSCTVTASVRGRQGRVFLRDGFIVDADAEGLRGKEAVFLLLTWIAPVLGVVDRCDRASVMHASVQELLLEHFVNEDHQRRD
jgi:DNA-binding response OmpR family regulator